MNTFFARSLLFLTLLLIGSYSSKAQDLSKIAHSILGKWVVDYEATQALSLCSQKKNASYIKTLKKWNTIFKFRKNNILITWETDPSSKKTTKNKFSWSLKKKDLPPEKLEQLKQHSDFDTILKQGYYIELSILEHGRPRPDRMVILKLEKDRLVILDVGCPVALKK